MHVIRIIIVLFSFPYLHLSAQELPLLDRPATESIIQEISGDASYEHIRFMTQFHRPGGGADGLWYVAEYVADKAEEYGLEDVEIIKQDYTRPPWNARFADLRLINGSSKRIASTLQSQLHIADYSRAVDVKTELVYIGAGTSDGDYENIDVAGKIVLTTGSIGAVMREAVWKRAAAGLVWYPDPEGRTGFGDHNISHPDQIRWMRVPIEGPNGEPGTFAFILSLRQGLDLRREIRNAAEPLRVHAYIDASFGSMHGEEPWQVMVEGRINGTGPDPEQDIIITAHIQEEKFSANDNASGSANILEIARALKKLIDEGKLERPRRTIRFWWVREFTSQRQYFADNPDAHKRMWVNINQDMAGANQAQDVMRVQNITRLPASRFHFFNDVVESVIEYMVDINNTELAQIQAGTEFNPVLSHLGSRHRFNAKMIYYHGNTDHVTFNETPIGVPGITFTNWPDHYIHTSDDDLWNIDRTQLQRNAAASAMMAYIMATADRDAFATLAATTSGKGNKRIGKNLQLGLQWIAREENKEDAYHRAVQQIDYAIERERKALASLGEIENTLDIGVALLIEHLDSKRNAAFGELLTHYKLFSGNNDAPAPYTLTQAEKELSEIVLAAVNDPSAYSNTRGQLSTVPGLHSLMASEIVNCIDGSRTGLDIYRYIAGQAREAGEHYYGTVSAESVLEYLNKIMGSEVASEAVR